MERKKKRDHDFAVNAFRVVQEATKEPEPAEQLEVKVQGKNPHAVALGRLGGLKGGNARARKLTPAQRSEVASKAAYARWQKHRLGKE